ncbi:restriction endonuclease subunit S [Maribacter luteus]|uniref:Type I restriction modification DNA specificity domain-containing protein n=1 Tax=Maribacter luteus TaxID=2594478 RepID=A0A6I2MMU9_9FLAO|nr:restriction endonuclease subunit S [Maribacter luteus]MRX62596.1 hypothetical protein [Maribacter luteus]
MELVELGEYIEVLSGYAFNSKLFNDKGVGKPIIRIRDVGKEKTNTYFDGEYDDKYLINSGDFLIGMDGDFRLAKWKGNEALLNQRVCKIWSKDSSILCDDYLLRLLPRELKLIEDTTSFATVKHLSVKKIRNIKIPLPPLETQKKIAAILDAADSYKQKTKALIEKYDQLTQSLFLDMFGDPVTNPKGWKEIKIEDVSFIVTKGSSPKWQGFEYISSGIRFITSENVRLGHLDCEKDKFVAKEFHEKLERSKLKKNDLLVNLVGASIGRGALMEEKFLPANINQAVAKIELNTEIVDSVFLLNQIITPQIQDRLIGNKVEGARANISLKNVRELKFLYPPIKLQNQFAEHAQAIEAQKALAEKSLQKSEALFNSLLQKAFKGELV